MRVNVVRLIHGANVRSISLISRFRNGWGATIVDALSTAILMGLNDIVDTQLEYISTIDFTDSHTSDEVSLFETTIRYLAGMLSAYDLLTGPYPNLASVSKGKHIVTCRLLTSTEHIKR